MSARGHPSRLSRLGRLPTGEAGPAPAWALAIVALLCGFIAVAGPRELTAASTAALRQQLASLSSLDTGAAVTAQWQAYSTQHSSVLTAGQVDAIGHSLAGALHPPLVSPAGRRWAGVTMPPDGVQNPAPSAIRSQGPVVEIAYRSALAANARLVSGTLPAAVGDGAPAGPATAQITVGAAVTTATAARFGLRPGSRLVLSPYQPGQPGVIADVTGVIRPADPAAAFWLSDPVLAAPQIVGINHPQQWWFGGVFIGRGALTAVQAAYSGASDQGTWFFPLSLGRLTAGQLPGVLAGVNALTSANVTGRAQAGAGASAAQLSGVAVSTGLGNALTAYAAQQQAVTAIDSLLIVGLFAAGLILLLVCARLAADAHQAELALLRARGASTRQTAARMLARTGCVTVPALAAGAALAVLAVPGGGNAGSWVLAGITALVAVAGPPVIAGWRNRRARPAAGPGREGELAGLAGAPRPGRRRRGVAELAVVAAAAGSLVALRQRGLVTGADPFLSASVVLVAAAAGLVVARAYPAVVRALLAAAARWRGLVGFLAVASAARSRLGAVLPALTLVLTLTLAAFAAIIGGSVTAGQEAASWQQVGADVLIQTGGQHTVTAAAGRAVGAVPGIRHTAAVYTVPSSSSLAATLVWPRPAAAGPASAQVGLTVVDPPQYAALAAGTPWPGFRPALLARDPARAGAVPVLATPGLAAAGRPVVLELDGTRLPVMIVGRIGATAAAPAGGSYVVLPSWAAPRLPALPGPRTLLATGTPTDLPALRAAIARTMPGSQLTLRQQVLAGLVDTPAQRARTRLSLLAGWTAAAFSAVALLFALAVSARPRDRLLTRLSALGMTPRQAGVLALADTVPLLCVAIIGMLAAVVVLALLAGPALNLTVFTGSAVPVPVRPDPLALLIPAAAVAVLTVVIVATERAASGRHDTGTALRHQEVM